MTDEPSPLRRVRFVVAYDGTEFHGFAENHGVPTVMGTLRGAIEQVTRTTLDLVGAGRTDAGVHAWGQVVSGDLPGATDLDGLVRRVNRMCGPRITIRSGEWIDDPEFSARFSARWRHYRYLVVNDEHANPFLTSVAWHVPQPLDVSAMQLACDPLIGEHDFSSFCRRPKPMADQPVPSMTRRVQLARWHAHGSEYGPGVLRFEIRANAFCHQMVRSIVGTLVDVGLGKMRAGEMRGVLVARDRAKAGTVAPPHGLCLWEVGYS